MNQGPLIASESSYMNGLGSLIKSVVVLLLAFAVPSIAGAKGAWSSKCEGPAENAKNTCVAKGGEATSADGVLNKIGLSKFGSTPQQHDAAKFLKDHGQANTLKATQSAKACEAAHEACKSACTKAEQERAKAEGSSNPTLSAQAKADEPAMKKASETCAAVIPLLAEMKSGAAQAANAAKQAEATEKSSGGILPLPIPIPLGGGDKKGEPTAPVGAVAPGTSTPTTPVTPEKLDCEANNNQQYSDCNNHFIEKCKNPEAPVVPLSSPATAVTTIPHPIRPLPPRAMTAFHYVHRALDKPQLPPTLWSENRARHGF